jgi:hypothetical protein
VKQAVSTPREKAREWGKWDSTRGNRAGLENVGYRTSKIKKEKKASLSIYNGVQCFLAFFEEKEGVWQSYV